PIAMYPPLAPPTVMVTCQYPGASAEVVAQTVAAPIEQQVNGVENMMYMSSACTNDGNYTLTVTFKHGIDMNLAQVLVQNRVSLANPLLPDVIKATGVTTKKRSPDILLAIGIYSPDDRFDQLYLSNYAYLHVRDELARLPGISDVTMFGQRDYSMRIWIDPDKLAALNMTAGDVVRALREQNLQVAAGQVGQSPMRPGQQTQVTLSTLGRLVHPEQFAGIIVKTSRDGRVVRIRDIGRVELGAKNQDISSEVDGKPVANLGIFQLPDANALATAKVVRAKIEDLKKDFPEGLDYIIRYDTTPFIQESIEEVFKTLFDSVALVALVVLLFLQNWRSALIPLVAVPVGIVGTFAVMLAMGFSLNNLTLFGLVLAIGIVVDDAIVVVECVEHHIERGLAPRDATIKAMSEVSAPVIAVGMVLSAVFIPCAFISGITGQFFRQFALTIASSTILSTFNSLTLSPALAAMLLRPRRPGVYETLPRVAFLFLGCLAGYMWLPGTLLDQEGSSAYLADTSVATFFCGTAQAFGLAPQRAAEGAGVILGGLLGWALSRPLNRVLGIFFGLFNRGFTATANGYARAVGGMLRVSVLVLLVYAGMLGLTSFGYGGFPKDLRQSFHEFKPEEQPAWLQSAARLVKDNAAVKWIVEFTGVPRGFIPSQDMGYMLVNIQLPDSAALERTKKVISKVNRICHSTMRDLKLMSALHDASEIPADGEDVMIVAALGDRLHFRTFDAAGKLVVDADEKTLTKKAPEIEVLRKQLLGLWPPHELTESEHDRVITAVGSIVGEESGINATVGIAGQSLLLNAYGSNFATMFITLKSFALRRDPDLYYEVIMNKLRQEFGKKIPEAMIAVFGPPPVRGVGRAGGYMIMIEDRGDLGPGALQRQTENLVKHANSEPELTGNTSVFRANVPQIYLDVDRRACMLKGVQLQDAFDTLQVYLGSLYVNDFNLFGRTWQVIAQAEQKYRDQQDDIRRLRIRNASGMMVPLGAVARVNEINGPLVLTRYNMYPAASINGNAKPGVSSGRAIEVMEKLADDPQNGLPRSMAYEWTELAFLELEAGNTAMIVFAFSVVMVFLMLAAQFESWSMPLAVILSVPLCILSALVGVYIAKMDINIFTQIGLVVLVGLASKNAILIVEFAKVIHRSGKPIREATLESCRLRLRPIIMTSLAFILGVIPLLVAHGAGAEMRQSLGMAVFSGMIGVTIFGVLLTPVFFYMIDMLSESHFFASPLVRRIGGITLGIITLSYLWRPSRWKVSPTAAAASPDSKSQADPFDFDRRQFK
ncbi:MAG: efflux RND transporter permease subunit, partial [Isosphaeraceae bacterium]